MHKKAASKKKWFQGKYEVLMLWSDKVEELQNNFNTVLQRFKSLKKRVQKDINLCKNYKDTMQKSIKRSYLMRKLTKQAKGLGICHTTQFSINISQTKSELPLMLQQSMVL